MHEAPSAPVGQNPGYPSRVTAWRSTIIIFVIAAIAMADRLAISMLIGPIKGEFNIGDFQASLLVGAAFASFYIIALLPIGWASDKYSRKRILFVCLLVWTLASIACGFATGFIMLFICRMLVGAGEAGLGPTGYGIIGSSFPREEVAKPIAMYNIGFTVGSALGVAAAGAILAAGVSGKLQGLPLIGDMSPWRVAFILIGLPGVITLFLIPILNDPKTNQASPSKSVEAILPYLKSTKTLWLLFFVGLPFASVGFMNVLAWAPELIQRKYEVLPSEAGATMGIVMLISGICGPILFSVCADALSKRGYADSSLRVGIVPLILSIPLMVMTMLAPSLNQFKLYLIPLMICLAMLGPMGFTLLQQLSPNKFRSRLTSLFVLAITIVSAGLATSVVGGLSEFVFGEGSLNIAIIATTIFFHGIAIVIVFKLFSLVVKELSSDK